MCSSSVAQLVEQVAVNHLVAGSSPARGANISINIFGKFHMINHKDNCGVLFANKNVSEGIGSEMVSVDVIDTVSSFEHQKEAESVDSIKVDVDQSFEAIDTLGGSGCHKYTVSLDVVDDGVAVQLKHLDAPGSFEKVITKSAIADMFPKGFEVILTNGSETLLGGLPTNSQVSVANYSDPMFMELYSLYFKDGVPVVEIQDCPMTSSLTFSADVVLSVTGSFYGVAVTLNQADTEFAASEVLVA